MTSLHKRSFVELPLTVDPAPLLREVTALPPQSWRSTYWGTPHCSVAMVLLRGGDTGTQDDFSSSVVLDHPVLTSLPSIAALLAPGGPFEGCRYAFLFAMDPHGVALAHTDGALVWHDLHRVHVPLLTHPDAKLIVEGRSQHLAPGRPWTFDNQSLHGFVNGPTRRVHLILDVPHTPRLQGLLADATHHPGDVDPSLAARTLDRARRTPSYPGDVALITLLTEMREAGWGPGQISPYLNTQGLPPPEHGTQWTPERVRAFAPDLFS